MKENIMTKQASSSLPLHALYTKSMTIRYVHCTNARSIKMDVIYKKKMIILLLPVSNDMGRMEHVLVYRIVNIFENCETVILNPHRRSADFDSPKTINRLHRSVSGIVGTIQI